MKLFLLFHKQQPIYLDILHIPLIKKTHIKNLFQNVLHHPLKTQQQWTFRSQICSLASAIIVKVIKLFLVFYNMWRLIENTKRLTVFKLKINFNP